MSKSSNCIGIRGCQVELSAHVTGECSRVPCGEDVSLLNNSSFDGYDLVRFQPRQREPSDPRDKLSPPTAADFDEEQVTPSLFTRSQYCLPVQWSNVRHLLKSQFLMGICAMINPSCPFKTPTWRWPLRPRLNCNRWLTYNEIQKVELFLSSVGTPISSILPSISPVGDEYP